MLRNQLIESRRPHRRLVRRNDERSFGFGVHGGEPRLQGGSHALLKILVDDHAPSPHINFFPDRLPSEAQNQNDFRHPGSANVVQYGLQQRTIV
jgi:hypothetical protein